MNNTPTNVASPRLGLDISLILLFVVSGAVLGVFLSRAVLGQSPQQIASGSSTTEETVNPAVESPASNLPEGTLSHLAERVRDSNASLNTLITLTSIIIGLIGLSFATGIWQVKKYTAHLTTTSLDAKVDEYERHLQKLLSESMRSIESLHASNIRNLVEAYAILWRDTALNLRKLDQSNCTATGDEATAMLDKKAAERERHFRIALCTANLFSTDQDVVIDAAQQLSSIAGPSSCTYLERTLDRLQAEAPARIHVQRALDQIRLRDKSGV